jgi:hypothetical protein
MIDRLLGGRDYIPAAALVLVQFVLIIASWLTTDAMIKIGLLMVWLLIAVLTVAVTVGAIREQKRRVHRG